MCLLCTIQQMAVGTIKRFLRRRRQARIFKLMAREARSPKLIYSGSHSPADRYR
jgi:hypothetical protein